MSTREELVVLVQGGLLLSNIESSSKHIAECKKESCRMTQKVPYV